jgi:hypothetical protein
MYAAGRRLGYEKPQSAQAPLCGFVSATVWAGGQCYALPCYLPKPSVTAGTLDEIPQNIYKNEIFGKIYC